MTALFSCVFGSSVLICVRLLETEEKRKHRIKRKKEREVKALTDRISSYAREVHKRFPGGDVVVGEKDLAEQLRKHPDVVVSALNALLGERKVQRAPLNGYWKLNVQ
jgi:hypothetical protein